MENQFIFHNPPFQSCHAPSLAETPVGLVAAWFGGSQEGASDVGIWTAWQVDLGWSPVVEVAFGLEGRQRYPCWNPVLYQELGGRLLLFYKVGPNPERWWGMVMHSADSGQTWSAPRRLPDGILGPIKNKPLRLVDGSLLCPSSSEAHGWQIHMERSDDGGATWERMAIPGDFQAIQPTILQHASGRLQILCRSTCGWIITSWSPDQGRTWSELEKTGLPNPNSGIDAVTLSDGRHLLVYNHSGVPPGQWGGARTPLNMALSVDGIHWQSLHPLENSSGEYSYPAVIQAADGRIHVLYTWKRTNIRHVSLRPNELAT